ncbi:MAG: glycine zipper 2TM domain-containing protein [Paracoccaceae bacterium]
MSRILVFPLLLVPLAACEDTGGYGASPVYPAAGYGQAQTALPGTVVDVRTVQVGSSVDPTAGAVIGGLAGALVGNQFGKGSGNALATGAGALGGAIAGSEIAKRQGGGAQYSSEWTVRLDNGQLVRFVQAVQGVGKGSRVTVVDTGNGWRMVL